MFLMLHYITQYMFLLGDVTYIWILVFIVLTVYLCLNCNNKYIFCCWSWIVTIIISIFVEMSRNLFRLGNFSAFLTEFKNLSIHGWHDIHLSICHIVFHILHFQQNLRCSFTRNACSFNSVWQPSIYWIFSSFWQKCIQMLRTVL